jgi:hypothetical protein
VTPRDDNGVGAGPDSAGRPAGWLRRRCRRGAWERDGDRKPVASCHSTHQRLESDWKAVPTPTTARLFSFVEDEIGLGRLIARVLTEEGYDARLESRGDNGLAGALQDAPAVVVLDVALPVL